MRDHLIFLSLCKSLGWQSKARECKDVKEQRKRFRSMRMSRKDFNLLVKDFNDYLLKESLKDSLLNKMQGPEARQIKVYPEYHDGVGLSERKMNELFVEYCKDVIDKEFPENMQGRLATLNWLKTKVEKKEEINDKIYDDFIERIYRDKNGIFTKLLNVRDKNKESIIVAKQGSEEAWKWHNELNHAKAISFKKWQELLSDKAAKKSADSKDLKLK